MILTPGVYHLDRALTINQPGRVLMGIGYPKLIAETGDACVVVKATEARVGGGIIFQAGPSKDPVTPALVQWGTTSSDAADGLLFDCFTRTGRFQGNPDEPTNQADVMVHIVSDRVIGDDLWLWRADHDTQGLVSNEDNYCRSALVVDGDDVILYGAAGEHTFGDITVWNGNRGRCYFYQCELPYDALPGYDPKTVGYRVGSNVTDHLGVGIGVYSFFRDHTHVMTQGIGVNMPGPGIQIQGGLTRYLAGLGGISSVTNTQGFNVSNAPAIYVSKPGPAYACKYSGAGGQPRPVSRNRYTEMSSKIGRDWRQLCSKFFFFGRRCVYEHYCLPKKKNLESFLGRGQFSNSLRYKRKVVVSS